MQIYTSHAQVTKKWILSHQIKCTFFNMSVNWEGGKWCHFSVTNLFILQRSDFWQAGNQQKSTNI